MSNTNGIENEHPAGTVPEADKTRKRMRLSMSQQIEIIQMVQEKRMKHSTVAREFGVPEQAISRVIDQRSVIEEACASIAGVGARKPINQQGFPGADTRVLDMLRQARVLKIPVTRGTLKALGRKVAALMATKATTDKQRPIYDDFSASNWWLDSFIARHSLQVEVPQEEAVGEDAAAAAARMAEIRRACEDYDVECIYSMTETGLFYRLLPKRSYLAPGEGQETVRGVEGMGAKELVKAVICANATGTRKIPLALIGRSKRPRCFGQRQPPVYYFGQERTWSDDAALELWWREFLRVVRKMTMEKVLLLVDSRISHENFVDPRGKVKVMGFPTGGHPPTGQGVIQAWKSRYKTNLLSIRNDTMPWVELLREQAKRRKMKRGTMGMVDGHKLHLLDAAELGEAGWKAVSGVTIARCWIKAGILPNAMQHEIARSIEARGGDGDADDGMYGVRDNLVDAMHRLSLGVARGGAEEDLHEALRALGLKPGQRPSPGSADAAKPWLTVEEDLEEIVRRDLQEKLMREDILESESEYDSDDSDSVGVDRSSADDSLPPFSEVADVFAELEAMAVASPSVSYHIRKAKLAWMRANSIAATRQLTTRERSDPSDKR